MKRTLVIGYGNPLRGDDGFGPVVAQYFSDRHADSLPYVETLIAQQLTLDLAAEIAAYDQVIFVDAAAVGEQAGLWMRLLPYERLESKQPPFTHHATIDEVLFAVKALYDGQPEVRLLTVVGQYFDAGPRLSEGVQQLVKPAVEMLIACVGSTFHQSTL